jgi:hypothetical protein
MILEQLEAFHAKLAGIFTGAHEEVFSFSPLSGRDLYVARFESFVVKVKNSVQHSKTGDRYG